ncbi:hypothetical protein FHW13_002769 [Dokdonella fugitiva]|nr:hypothetical protein [Dokdonella fugitiva]
MRIVVLLLALVISSPVWSAPVYKCKGAKGETIYQNLPCPKGTQTVAHGEYAREPDNPTQYYEALREGNAIRARREAAAEAAMIDRSHESSATSSSEAETSAAVAKSDAKYREDRKRWGNRLAGPKPEGYDERNPKVTLHRGAAESTGISPSSTSAPVTYDDCKQVGSSVHCVGSDGSVASGSIDAWGNGRASGAGGDVRFRPNPVTGKPQSDSGTCVKDVYGQCQ